MKRTTVFSLFFITLGLLSSCGSDGESSNTKENKNNLMGNPFAEESTLDFQVPDFDKIKNEHFRPALEEGMRIQLEEIEAIANNEEAPTFENTLVALEKTGAVLKRTSRVFYLLAGAETNDEIREIQQEMAPKFAALSDAIYLNTNLFNRVKAIKEDLPNLNLDLESERLVTYYYDQFVSAGAELSESDKELLKSYNEELASLTTKFSNLSMEAMKEGAFITDNVDDLEGLSEAGIATAAEAAKAAGHEGKWLIPLMNTTQQPVLSSLKNAEIRKTILNNSFERAQKGNENDTRELIVKIAQLRAKRANLLGFESYAHWNLNNQMAKNPENVDNFFAQLVPAAVKRVKEEENELLAFVQKDNPNATKVNPSDWNYYAEQLRRAKYDLDEEEIKPYLELNNVLENGVFYAVNKLYGLTFSKRTDLPVYHEDVIVYDVFDHDGSRIGIFYSDNFARPTKRGGAWMSNLVGQSHLLGTLPVIYNVCNFTKPAEGQPALLTWDDVTTLFHEFGHSLHGFFADQKYPSLSGTNVPRDFVELPSQFHEHWALEPSVFANYAKHYETNEPMPADLVEKIKNSTTFNQGYRLAELLAAAQLDLEWHKIDGNTEIEDALTFEKEALERTGLLLEAVPPRYKSTYFNHVFGGGYGAGYYSYIWTEMLDNDAFAWFEANGGMTRENGDRFRKMILSIGNTVDLEQAFIDFIGREPSIEPMLKARGIN